MLTSTQCGDETTLGGALLTAPVELFTVPAIAESAEAVIEDLDAPVAAAPALLDGLALTGSGAGHVDATARADRAAPLSVRIWQRHDPRPSMAGGPGEGADIAGGPAISIDEYAKAVLYNGLRHYHAARTAAQRACAHDEFVLLEGALAELVEASVRSGHRGCAAVALRKLEARAEASRSSWAMGVAACARALASEDDRAEGYYLEAIERLGGTSAPVTVARVRLLYGEWLRRQGRRVDARAQLACAHRSFTEVGLGGFAERARRELLATGETVRKRTDDRRLDLTPQEAQIAQLAASGRTNAEIGRRLFISPRTVEWHLRKVFTKLGVSSRRELNASSDPLVALAG